MEASAMDDKVVPPAAVVPQHAPPKLLLSLKVVLAHLS
jgi:hypothetical protein